MLLKCPQTAKALLEGFRNSSTQNDYFHIRYKMASLQYNGFGYLKTLKCTMTKVYSDVFKSGQGVRVLLFIIHRLVNLWKLKVIAFHIYTGEKILNI